MILYEVWTNCRVKVEMDFLSLCCLDQFLEELENLVFQLKQHIVLITCESTV
jgi:hypothetical protein